MAYSDRELLARLIECEAGGEGDNGMKAVAGVVMNRVEAAGGEYARIGQRSIRKIIMQPGQFVCAMEMVGGVYKNMGWQRRVSTEYPVNRKNGLFSHIAFSLLSRQSDRIP